MNSPHSLSQAGENIYTWTELTYIKRVVYLRAAVFSTASGPLTLLASSFCWLVGNKFFFLQRTSTSKPKCKSAAAKSAQSYKTLFWTVKYFSRAFNHFGRKLVVSGENGLF